MSRLLKSGRRRGCCSVNDGKRRCPHGWPVETRVDEDEWRTDYAVGCGFCGDKPAGMPYKLHATPEERVEKEREYMEEMQEPVAPLPTEEAQAQAEGDVCAVCGELLRPGIALSTTPDGRLRHVTGSPECRRDKATPAPEETSPWCPTCGRPTSDDVPYDLPAIRAALLKALAALDELERSPQRQVAAMQALENAEGYT
jgi:hypothetical protein